MKKPDVLASADFPLSSRTVASSDSSCWSRSTQTMLRAMGQVKQNRTLLYRERYYRFLFLLNKSLQRLFCCVPCKSKQKRIRDMNSYQVAHAAPICVHSPEGTFCAKDVRCLVVALLVLVIAPPAVQATHVQTHV